MRVSFSLQLLVVPVTSPVEVVILLLGTVESVDIVVPFEIGIPVLGTSVAFLVDNGVVHSGRLSSGHPGGRVTVLGVSVMMVTSGGIDGVSSVCTIGVSALNGVHSGLLSPGRHSVYKFNRSSYWFLLHTF